MSRYGSTLADTLQLQMKRNTELSSLVRNRLLECLAAIGSELQINNLPSLKCTFTENVLSVSEQQWASVKKAYDQKENALVSAAIFQAQSPSLDEILDRIFSGQLDKEHAKGSLQNLMISKEQQRSEQSKIIIQQAHQKAGSIIQQANQEKEKIIQSANQIEECSARESLKIIDNANNNAAQIINQALKSSRIEHVKIINFREQRTRLQQQIETMMHEKNQLEKARDELLDERIKFARKNKIEHKMEEFRQLVQQLNRKNEAKSEEQWNMIYNRARQENEEKRQEK